MHQNRSSFSGVIFGMIAGAAWGLAYLIPNILFEFSSLEITLGRYLMFGLYSLILFIIYKENPRDVPIRVWFRALLYAFTGNVGFFFFLVLAIQYAGATIATLIIGTLPIVLSVVGNLQNKEFPFKIMVFPAFSILIGVFLLSISDQAGFSDINVSGNDFLFGLVCCFIALILWTWYGISNANFLKKESQVSPNLFSTMIGMQTLTLVLITFFISELTNQRLMTNLLAKDELFTYLIGIIALGIIGSWVGTWAWNQTSIRLTVSMAGMMIVFETLFGLLYVYIYRAAFPSMIEWVSIMLILLGVSFGIWRINQVRYRGTLKET